MKQKIYILKLFLSRRENNMENYDGIIVPWDYVASLRDFIKYIVIFRACSIENNGNFDIFRSI